MLAGGCFRVTTGASAGPSGLFLRGADRKMIRYQSGSPAKTELRCRLGSTILCSMRVPRLFEDLSLARFDGRFPRLFDKLTREQLLILNNFGTHSLTDQQRFQLFEIVEKPLSGQSTLITAQFPVAKWHDLIADPTVADAILDRVVHNAHRSALQGDSMRKKKAAPLLTGSENGEINHQ